MKIDRVVTHVDCPDGYASAKIAYDYLSAAPPEIVFVQYQTPEHAALEPLPNVGRTLFVDMTPPREKADAFLENGDVVLDHHEYASDIIMSFARRGQGVMGNNGRAECGARLLCTWLPSYVDATGYDYDSMFSPFSTACVLADLIAVRDTWKRSDPRWNDACAASEALMALRERVVDADARWFLPGPAVSLFLAGQAIHARRMKRAAELAKSAWRSFFDHHGRAVRLAVLTDGAGGIVSDAADLVEDADVVASFRFDTTHATPYIKYSLRSRGGFDVGAICSALGGGGHAAAGGFKLVMRDLNPFDMLIRELEAWSAFTPNTNCWSTTSKIRELAHVMNTSEVRPGLTLTQGLAAHACGVSLDEADRIAAQAEKK